MRPHGFGFIVERPGCSFNLRWNQAWLLGNLGLLTHFSSLTSCWTVLVERVNNNKTDTGCSGVFK